MNDYLKMVAETLKTFMERLEFIRTSLAQLKPGIQTERILRDSIDEYLKTILADLLILADFIFECQSCYDENEIPDEQDLKLLLQLTEDIQEN